MEVGFAHGDVCLGRRCAKVKDAGGLVILSPSQYICELPGPTSILPPSRLSCVVSGLEEVALPANIVLCALYTSKRA